MSRLLEKLLERASAWPKAAQDELLRAAEEIEARHAGKSRSYRASAGELSAIDEGLRQLRDGELVPEEEMEAFFKRKAP